MLLIGEERILDEVWKYPAGDVAQPSRFPLDRVVASVRPDRTASEVFGHQLDHLATISVLADRYAWPYFPADPDSRSWADRNGEASLSVEVARNVRLDVDLGARARVLRRS